MFYILASVLPVAFVLGLLAFIMHVISTMGGLV